MRSLKPYSIPYRQTEYKISISSNVFSEPIFKEMLDRPLEPLRKISGTRLMHQIVLKDIFRSFQITSESNAMKTALFSNLLSNVARELMT